MDVHQRALHSHRDRQSHRKKSMNHSGDILSSQKKARIRERSKTLLKPRDIVVSNGEAMSGTDSYVQQWLARTKKDAPKTKSDRRMLSTHGGTRTGEDDGAPLDRGVLPTSNQSDLLNFMQKRYEPEIMSYNDFGKRKRVPSISSETSFLETAFQVPRIKSPTRKSLEAIKEPVPATRNKRRVTGPFFDNTSGTNSPVLEKKSFEKRPRYKTREDRYEPKTKSKHEKKTHDRNKVKKTKSSKVHSIEKDGDDVPLRRFKSRLVGDHRLTLKPDEGGTFFKQERESAGTSKGGVPDLAFSEMRFLQEPRRRSADLASGSAMSKARRGAPTVTEKLLNHSSYFQSAKTALVESVRNSSIASYRDERHRAEPYRTANDGPLSLLEADHESGHMVFPYRRRGSTTSCDPPNQTLRSSLALISKCIDSVEVSPYFDAKVGSLDIHPERQKTNMLRKRSSSMIPEDVQELLYNTGIFSYTRLQKPSLSPMRSNKRSLHRNPSSETCSSEKHNRLWHDFLKSTRHSALSDKSDSPRRSKYTQASSPNSRQDHDESKNIGLNPQHNDPQTGCHQLRVEDITQRNEVPMHNRNLPSTPPRTTSKDSASIPQEQERPPTRVQLASAAYVKNMSAKRSKEQNKIVREDLTEKARVTVDHERANSAPPVLAEATRDDFTRNLPVSKSQPLLQTKSIEQYVVTNTENENQTHTSRSSNQTDKIPISRGKDIRGGTSENSSLTTSATSISHPAHTVQTLPRGEVARPFKDSHEEPIELMAPSKLVSDTIMGNTAPERGTWLQDIAPTSHYHLPIPLPRKGVPFSDEVLFASHPHEHQGRQYEFHEPQFGYVGSGFSNYLPSAERSVQSGFVQSHRIYHEPFETLQQNGREAQDEYQGFGRTHWGLHNSQHHEIAEQYHGDVPDMGDNEDVDNTMHPARGFDLAVTDETGRVDEIEDVVASIPGFWSRKRQY